MSDEETNETAEETETQEEVEQQEEGSAATRGKTLTEAEVQELIEKVRKQEKDKLYGKIEELSGTVSELNAKAKAEQEVKEKVDAEAKAKADAKRKAELSTEERLAEQMKTFEEQLAKEATERMRLQEELAEERQRQEVETYRQELLKQAGDEIIPDLVRGETRQDIEHSIAFAKTRYQELFQATKSKAEGKVTQNMPRTTNPDPAALDEAELEKSLANLDIDPRRYQRDLNYRSDMDKKRTALLEQIGGMYQKSVGR